jgi:gentisate 1,2-dioxygenase
MSNSRGIAVEGSASETRAKYYDEMANQSLAPLWERLRGLVPLTPRPRCVPAGWHFTDIRPMLMRAGELLTMEEAERRVLVIENPGIPGQSKITNSLYAGMQLLLPGERAPAHRHTACALRFILEGNCAYTAVDGERTSMQPGDFVLTPSWTWHDHGNDGNEPVIWLDGLDLPIVNFLDAGFSENYPEVEFPVSKPMGDCEGRYSGSLLPEKSPGSLSSPLFNYRYRKAREALAHLQKNGPPDRFHGHRLRYVNPETGGPVMPTISAAIQLLPRYFETAAYRATDATVFVCAEGRGTSQINDFAFDWGPKDVFVVPSWTPVIHHATEEAVLFSFSDRATQEKLGFWREQKGRNAVLE